MLKKGIIITLAVVALLLLIPIFFALPYLFNLVQSTPISENSKFITTWCYEQAEWNEETQTYKVMPSECENNVVYNDGLDALALDTIGLNNYNFSVIALCNATAGCSTQVAAQNTLFSEYNGCGLQSKNATYTADIAGTGNFSIYVTYTSTCDGAIVNATKLRDVTTMRNLSGTTFTARTLNNNDELRINITGQHS